MAVSVPPVKVAAKSWVALVGTSIATLIVILHNVAGFLPPDWTVVVTAIVGVLTSISVFFVPNQLTDAQVQDHLAKQQPGSTPWPTS